jgi:hypothetical protein
MEKKISVSCPKSDSITSMTEAFFGFKPGTLSSKHDEEEEYESDSD